MLAQVMRYSDPFMQLKRSKFRRSFRLTPYERKKAMELGLVKAGQQALAIIKERLNDPEAYGYTDGKQTPWTGIIFKAQHATATCCRKCMLKWHEIPRHRELTDDEVRMTLKLILKWIAKEMYR